MTTFIDASGLYGDAAKSTPVDAPKGINVNGIPIVDVNSQIPSRRIALDVSGTAIPSGVPGYYQESIIGAGFVTTSGVYNTGNSAGITLGPGTYEIVVVAEIYSSGTTTFTDMIVSVGTQSGTSAVGTDGARNMNRIQTNAVSSTGFSLATPSWRVVVPPATTQTYYPKVRATFTGSAVLSYGHMFVRSV